MQEYIRLERGDVYLVYVGWNGKLRRLLVKVVDGEETDYLGCEITGGETTAKGVRVGMRLTVHRRWFHGHNKQN